MYRAIHTITALNSLSDPVVSSKSKAVHEMYVVLSEGKLLRLVSLLSVPLV